MAEEYPKFTVIIPQKDRAEYLVHTLRTCMIQDYPNFEVIVGDDCSEDNSVDVVRELQKKDSRIKLIAHNHHVGMRENFEIALAEVKEGYVMALGGDDGLVAGGIWRMFEIIKETGAELLTWSQAGFKYPMAETAHSVFAVPRQKFKGVKMVKSTDFLNRIAKTMNYMTVDCPMFYVKGVASIELVNRVKNRTPDGRFYYCPTPDGFSGVVLAGEVEEYAYTREPLSISGDSTKSQGRNYHRTDDKSRKEAEQFFKDNMRVTMHKELASQPYSPIITLMTADYLLTARDLPGWPGKFEMFTWEHLIKRTIDTMKHNFFSSDVLLRELNILQEIAKQHHVENILYEQLKDRRRKVAKERSTDGFIITSNIFGFNGTEVNINNVYDAALAVNFAYRHFNQLSLGFFTQWLRRSIGTVLHHFKYQKDYLPSLDQ